MSRALIVSLGLWAAAAAAQAPSSHYTLPDPTEFGVRMEMGDIGKAREWLAAGLPPDFLADRIGSGLMIAAWRGDIAMMALFVSRGANVNHDNTAGERALMHAAWRGHLEAVRWLIERGAQVNSPPMRWSALHYAAFAGHAEVATLLLRHGADVNAVSTNGSSPLMMAVYEGHEPVVRELLAKGADPKVKNDRGEGALDWAFRFGRLAIARVVASSPADFVVAANRPKQQWREPVRSVPEAQALEAIVNAPQPPPSALDAEIEELYRVREMLVARRMFQAVARLDNRIETMRAKAKPRTKEIEELERIRAYLAARGMTNAVNSLDRRIEEIRSGTMPKPAPGAVLEISARRAAPQEQSMRIITEPGP